MQSLGKSKIAATGYTSLNKSVKTECEIKGGHVKLKLLDICELQTSFPSQTALIILDNNLRTFDICLFSWDPVEYVCSFPDNEL